MLPIPSRYVLNRVRTLASAGRLGVSLIAGTLWSLSSQAAEEAASPTGSTIPISRPARTAPVDFDREVLPVLKANCLACHNRTTTKADLLLESPADILKGGESGPAVVPGKSAESLLLKVASHAAKPRMPPRENKANARDLTPAELGLIALWIDEGTKASQRREEAITWHSLPAHLNHIYAVAVSPDANYAACGRANQIHVYHLPTGRVTRLEDPALAPANGAPGIAQRDVVNALAFSPDSTLLASGGYREVKLWRLDPGARLLTNAPIVALPPSTNPPAFATGVDTNGTAFVADGETNRFLVALRGHAASRQAVKVARRDVDLRRGDVDFQKAQFEGAGKELQAQAERLKKADEAERANAKALAEKLAALETARSAKSLAEVLLTRLEQKGTNAAGYTGNSKQARERIEAATKALEKADGEWKQAQLKESTAENEQQLAAFALRRGEGTVSSTRWALRESEQLLDAAQRSLATVEAIPVPPIRAVAVSTNGTWAATADEAKTVTLWRVDGAVPIRDFRAPSDGVKSLRFSERDAMVAEDSSGMHEWLLTPAWKLERTLGSGGPGSPIADRVTSLAFRPDGRRLASGGGEPSRSGEVLLWDPESGSLFHSFTNIHSDTVLAMAFSPDGWQLASGGADRFAKVVELAGGRAVRAFEGHTGHVLALGWAAHGRTLITAGADNVAKFWDCVSGDRRKTITGFSKELTGVGFVGTAAHVFVASGDASMRVYNENAEKVRDLEGAADFINAAAISPDGAVLVAGGQDGVLRVWRGATGKPSHQFAAPEAPQVVTR